MKKTLLSIIVLSAISFCGFSQNKLILPEVQYQDLKAKGQLKKDIQYLPIADVHPTGFQQKSEKPESSFKSTLGGSLACSCLAPIDATFSIGEFTNGIPPDYRNDDGSTLAKTIPFNFCLYGTNYTQFYLNNNGNITFGGPEYTFSAVGFPSASYIMVAPFWADVDTRNLSSGLVYYKITPTYVICEWPAVGYYSSMADKVNTFQLIITDGTDPILPAGNNIAFCYGDMQWTTGAASQGVNGFGGIAATVGCNKGDNISYLQMGRFDQPGLAYDGGYGNNDGVSWLDNQSMYFNVCNATNIAPISSGLNNCDTIKICGSGDTLYLNGLFLAPEIGQNTTISVNLNGTPNATVISNTPGNTADAIVMIIATAANAGNNHITFTATDNGIPIGTTTIDVNIFVDTTGISNFNPIITGNLEFCEGGSSVLNVTPTNYDNYVWNNGTYGTTLTVDSSGTYYCTASQNGCYKSASVVITENPNPIPTITGATFTCNGNPTIIYLDNSYLYSSYTWNNGSTNDSLGTPGGGPYTITVTDSNGCVGTSPPITVTNVTPVVTVPIPSPFCPGTSTGLTATPSPVSGASFAWSTGATTQTIQATTAGTYTVTVNYLANGCTADTTVTVTTFDSPNANFSSNPNGQSGPNINVQFTDLSTVPTGSIVSWMWNFGDSVGVYHFGQNPTHAYLVNGTYMVSLVSCSSDGCCDTTEFPYTIVSDIEVPNVFTPNVPGASNVNQYLFFKNLEYFPNTKLMVYNRWGNKVFESSNYDNKWNGGSQNDGVYYYVLDGPLFKEPKYGFVQILR